MFILDRLLIGGLAFIFDKIASAADAERDDAAAINEEILALQMRFELGDVVVAGSGVDVGGSGWVAVAVAVTSTAVAMAVGVSG